MKPQAKSTTSATRGHSAREPHSRKGHFINLNNPRPDKDGKPTERKWRTNLHLNSRSRRLMTGTGFPQTVKTVRVTQMPGSSNQDGLSCLLKSSTWLDSSSWLCACEWHAVDEPHDNDFCRRPAGSLSDSTSRREEGLEVEWGGLGGRGTTSIHKWTHGQDCTWWEHLHNSGGTT